MEEISHKVQLLKQKELELTKGKSSNISYEWLELVYAWDELNNEQNSAECLKQAILTANSLTNCNYIIMYCEEKQKISKIEFLRILIRAESYVDNIHGLAICYNLWDKYQDILSAKNCLEKMEKFSHQQNTPKNWLDIAKHTNLNDDQKSRYILIAEGASTTSAEWLECAGTWKSIGINEAHYLRCMAEAEEQGKSEDYCNKEEILLHYLYHMDLENFIRYILEIEEKTTTVHEYRELGDVLRIAYEQYKFNNIFLIQKKLKFYLDQGKALINNKNDEEVFNDMSKRFKILIDKFPENSN